MAVFWVVAPCRLVEVSVTAVLAAAISRAREAVSTSDTSVNFYQTTRRNIPEDSLLNEVVTDVSKTKRAELQKRSPLHKKHTTSLAVM
jgi:hypothetical protein